MSFADTVFLQIEDLWQPWIYQHHFFPNRIWRFSQCFNLSHYYYTCYDDMWSVIFWYYFCKKTAIQKAQIMDSLFFFLAIKYFKIMYSCSVAKLYMTLCDPMNCSTSGFSVLHHLSVCSNSCPSSRWCHRTISSSVIPFSSCPQSFPVSGSFPVNQLFPSSSQHIGASASASVLSVNIQRWFPLGLTGLISLLSKIMCVCVYVCVYICLCVYVYIYIYI